MNSDELRFLSGGLLVSRSFLLPASVRFLESFNNEYVKDGKIYCWIGADSQDHYLVRVDERSLDVDCKTSIGGVSAKYVDSRRLLFSHGDEDAVLVDIASLSVVRDGIKIPPVFIARYKFNDNWLFYSTTSSFGVFAWPSIENVWEACMGDINIKCYVVLDDSLYCVHTKGVFKVDLYTGKMHWSKVAQECWRSNPVFQSSRFGKILRIRTEQTGIVGTTLVVCFDPQVIAGIDINSGDIQWVIDTIGPHKLRVTKEGIGWYIKNDAIHMLDIRNGILLPTIPIQFGTELEKTGSARIGGFDMSTTHIIAESTVETKSGKNGYILGINRESGIVDWAVPIEGMVTKLFLLNNRVYATGMMVCLDDPKPTAKTLVIEGEGGYIPD